MGFEPNLYAQRLRSGNRQDTIALCTGEDLGVMILTRWALSDALHAQGWKVDVHSNPNTQLSSTKSRAFYWTNCGASIQQQLFSMGATC
jgi:hypothetical protein